MVWHHVSRHQNFTMHPGVWTPLADYKALSNICMNSSGALYHNIKRSLPVSVQDPQVRGFPWMTMRHITEYKLHRRSFDMCQVLARLHIVISKDCWIQNILRDMVISRIELGFQLFHPPAQPDRLSASSQLLNSKRENYAGQYIATTLRQSYHLFPSS